MRKLDKLVLNKMDIAQSDILRIKEMQNIKGGFCCDFICGNGLFGFGSYQCDSLDACYDKFGEICEGGGYISCS